MIQCSECGRPVGKAGFPSIAMNVCGARINIKVTNENHNDPDSLNLKDWCGVCALEHLKGIMLYAPWTDLSQEIYDQSLC